MHVKKNLNKIERPITARGCGGGGGESKALASAKNASFFCDVLPKLVHE